MIEPLIARAQCAAAGEVGVVVGVPRGGRSGLSRNISDALRTRYGVYPEWYSLTVYTLRGVSYDVYSVSERGCRILPRLHRILDGRAQMN